MACIYARSNRFDRGEPRMCGCGNGVFPNQSFSAVQAGLGCNRGVAQNPFSRRIGAPCPAVSASTLRETCCPYGTLAAANASEYMAAARNAQQGLPPPDNSGVCRFAAFNPVGDSLYGASRSVPVCTSCCDPMTGCHAYNVADRDPYWPAFAHPRWLPCCQLYRRGL